MKSETSSPFSTGANQTGVRQYNERLILSLLQRGGPMPGSRLARLTGLSPQTASVILRKLEADGLLMRGESQRGKVGKPSVPMGINPDGLFSCGLKIGRRSADLLLMDFQGTVRRQLQLRYPYPMPDQVFGFLRSGLAEIMAGLEPAACGRICGIGIAVPFELWNWHELAGAPEDEFLAWKTVDFAAEAARFSDLPVYVVNDATAACRAEHMFGRGKAYRDYAYFFLGAFIGGGVVLNHQVLEGNQGNAGALGSLPSRRPDGQWGKLIDTASIHVLERRLARAGADPGVLWQMPQDWASVAGLAEPWLEEAALALAEASLATCAVIDFQAVLIDGAMPAGVRSALVEKTRARLARLDARGLIAPAIEEGAAGANARAIGAASGPVISQYLLTTNAGFADST